MAEGAVIPTTLIEPPVEGRSLWADARERLFRNKAAVAGIVLLGAIAIACILGPFVTGHPFDKVYPDYVRAPASLQAYPQADQITPQVERIGSRVRAKTDNIVVNGDSVRIDLTSTSTRPIDERLLAYFERSDLFGPAQVVERTDEGRRLVVDVPLERVHFLFGTDTNGRDLLTRTMMAGRVSLAIGLLATFVAITIGVIYGATSGYLGART
jgi:oligopeptide transport system permease protein